MVWNINSARCNNAHSLKYQQVAKINGLKNKKVFRQGFSFFLIWEIGQFRNWTLESTQCIIFFLVHFVHVVFVFAIVSVCVYLLFVHVVFVFVIVIVCVYLLFVHVVFVFVIVCVCIFCLCMFTIIIWRT